MGLLGISKKGKWIIGGVCAFAVVATATTGLAAWVIGQNTDDNTKGQMNVTTIDDKSVTLTIDKTASDLVVMFGPNGKAPEAPGTPVVTASSGTNEEDLKFTIKGSYTVGNAAGDVKVGAKLTLGEKAQKLIKDTDDNNKNYINAPGTASETTAGEYDLGELTLKEVDSTKTFEGEYSFTWGSAFGGMNPCEYFDGTEGKGYAEAKAALAKISAATEGLFEEFTVTVFVK